MTKSWYPIINADTCTECGVCVDKCSNGVYDKNSPLIPLVIHVEGCVHNCHGCGNLCPSGSITYFGDNTGWTPPNLNTDGKEACGCNTKNTYAVPDNQKEYNEGRGLVMNDLKTDTACGCDSDCTTDGTGAAPEPAARNLTIEWRHLDVEDETCDRCYDTGENLAAEVKRLRRALSPQGIDVEYIETKLGEGHVAESNVILFNGIPIEDILSIEVSSNFCGSCTDLLGTDTYCRTIRFDGNEYEDVPAKAIRQAVYKVLELESGAPVSTGCCTDDSDCGCGDTQAQSAPKAEEATMTVAIYEPAMCCPTGVCGPGIDPELLRVSAAVEALNKCSGVEVRRFNLTNSPQEFVKNAEVSKLLNDEGVEVLPIVTVNGKVVMTKRYPSNDEFEELLDITCDCLHGACPVDDSEPDDCGCGNAESSVADSSCCGEAANMKARMTDCCSLGEAC